MKERVKMDKKFKALADSSLTLSQLTNFKPFQTERDCRRQF